MAEALWQEREPWGSSSCYQEHHRSQGREEMPFFATLLLSRFLPLPSPGFSPEVKESRRLGNIVSYDTEQSRAKERNASENKQAIFQKTDGCGE